MPQGLTGHSGHTFWPTSSSPPIQLEQEKRPLPQRNTSQNGHTFWPITLVDYLDDYTFVGDKLLVAEDGENLRSNKQPIANWATGKFRVNNHAHVLCGSPFCNLRYLCYLLNEMNLSAYITGSTQPKLSQKSLLNIEISLPSRNLQDKIVSFIQPIDNKVTCLTRTNGHLSEQFVLAA